MLTETVPATFNAEAQKEFASEAEWKRDYEAWKNGDYSTTGDYAVRPKRDMNGWPHSHGWVVTPVDQKMINALPGATWSHSRDGAFALIDAYILAGEEEDKGGKRFWAAVRLFNRAKGKS